MTSRAVQPGREGDTRKPDTRPARLSPSPGQKLAEIGFFGAVAVFGCLMMWQAMHLPLFIRGAVGPGFYPALVLGVLIVVALALLIASMHPEYEAAPDAGGEAEGPRGNVLRLIAAGSGLVLFVPLMNVVGFPLAATLFLSSLMALLWPRLDLRAAVVIVVIAIVVAVLVDRLFEGLFYVIFPPGPWEL